MYPMCNPTRRSKVSVEVKRDRHRRETVTWMMMTDVAQVCSTQKHETPTVFPKETGVALEGQQPVVVGEVCGLPRVLSSEVGVSLAAKQWNMREKSAIPH